MEKPLHRSTIVSFLSSLPASAGANFIWDFLLFQFYIYSRQEHERKPMPSWFMGKEAWSRWFEYSDEAKWHAKEWAREKNLMNPIISSEYKIVSENSLRKEKLRMSRIAGPNFCIAKFGEEAYNPENDICFSCPFLSECEILFSKNTSGKSLYQELSSSIRSDAELKQLSGSHVTCREILRMEEYSD